MAPSIDDANKGVALILAAARRGVQDSVAALQSKSHKCLVHIDGEVMLVRVINSMLESGWFRKIYICIEGEEPLRTEPQLAAWLDNGTIGVVKSEGNLADSVVAAQAQIEAKGESPWPMVITTGDNALQTFEMVAGFMDQASRADADISLAFTRDDIVLAEYPDAGLAFHRLKDAGYSANNIYSLGSEKAMKAVRVFESGGQFGKRHWRILKSFGLIPFLLYKTKAVSGPALIRRIGRNLGVSLEMIVTPFAYGPIDVDNPRSFALCDRILKARRAEIEGL